MTVGGATLQEVLRGTAISCQRGPVPVPSQRPHRPELSGSQEKRLLDAMLLAVPK